MTLEIFFPLQLKSETSAILHYLNWSPLSLFICVRKIVTNCAPDTVYQPANIPPENRGEKDKSTPVGRCETTSLT